MVTLTETQRSFEAPMTRDGYVVRPAAENRICIVQDAPHTDAATFLQTFVDHLPAQISVLHGVTVPHLGQRPLLCQSWAARAYRKGLRTLLRRDWEWELTWAYSKALRRFRPQAVLAQFGASGVRVRVACKKARVPLIVSFYGVDASRIEYLREHAKTYPLLFRDAAAVLGVSREMCRQLIKLGAPSDRVHYAPFGVDSTAFFGAKPEQSLPVFLAVGRFVDKKAPHLTILAFSQVLRVCPEARLVMIGDGPLLGSSRDLASGLGLGDAIEFLGACSHQKIQETMRGVRAIVQHSLVAADGDCEGTPVAIIEAGASGLPVVATRHAGIPDVVVEEETGFLVDEHDVQGMARHMTTLAQNPELAGRLGRSARERVQRHFSLAASMRRVWTIIDSCIQS